MTNKLTAYALNWIACLLRINIWETYWHWREQGWRSGETARLPPVCPGFDSRTRRHMWVEFVVGSLPCSERFFSGYSCFPLSSKTNISKFQFDLDYCQALYHEPLARVIAQALPVFDIKFTFLHLQFLTVGVIGSSRHVLHTQMSLSRPCNVGYAPLDPYCCPQMDGSSFANRHS